MNSVQLAIRQALAAAAAAAAKSRPYPVAAAVTCTRLNNFRTINTASTTDVGEETDKELEKVGLIRERMSVLVKRCEAVPIVARTPEFYSETRKEFLAVKQLIETLNPSLVNQEQLVRDARADIDHCIQSCDEILRSLK